MKHDTSQINIPCKVVEEVVEEDHGDDSFSVANFTSLNVHSGQSSPGGESADHATSCNEEKRSTTNSVYHESPEPCLEHVNHEDETVESVTVERIRDTNIGKNSVKVVSSQTGAGPLREDTTSHADEDSLASSTGREEFRPTTLSSLTSNGSLDFIELEANTLVLFVAVGVVLGEDLESLLVLATRNEPTRTLGKQENKDDLNSGWCSLHKTGKSPCPVADDTECAVGNPATEERAKVVHRAGGCISWHSQQSVKQLAPYLYKAVTFPRSRGCASSVMRRGEAKPEIPEPIPTVSH